MRPSQLSDLSRLIARLAWAAVGVALVFVLLADVRPAIQSWARVPQQIADMQTAVELVPGQIVGQVLPIAQAEIQAARVGILAEVDKQATGLRGDLLPRVDTALAIVDGRTKDALAQVAGVRSDLAPAITNAAALVKDAQDSIDDLYPDLKAAAESATVAITSTAYASQAVRDAAPQVAQSVIGIGKSADGIAADIHTATADFVRPKTFWQKFKAFGETVGKVAARFL
jgi:hypothetical protein